MRIRNFVLSGFAGIVALTAATAAHADTSVYNRYENRHIYNGSSKTNVTSTIDSVSKTYTNSQSIKVETYGGDVNISNASYDGTNLTGSGHSSNLRIVDPVSIITVVEQNDFNVTREWTEVDQTTKYNFSGTDREHEVGNRFN